MYSQAFRRYVKRIERRALAGQLDAIRTLGAIAIALSTLTIPGHADSMLGTNPVAPPPLGAPVPGAAVATAPPTGEHWTIKALLFVHGAVVHTTDVGDAVFTDGNKCQSAVLSDKQLLTTSKIAGEAAFKKYGDGSGVVVVCALDLQ